MKSSRAQPAMRLINAVRFVKQQCSDAKSPRVNWPKALQSCALFFSCELTACTGPNAQALRKATLRGGEVKELPVAMPFVRAQLSAHL